MKPGSAAARPGASPRSHCCRRFQANPGRKRVGQSDSNSDCETVPTTVNPHRECPVRFQLDSYLGGEAPPRGLKGQGVKKAVPGRAKEDFLAYGTALPQY